MTKNKNNILVISLGDPAGIGTEIVLKALGSKKLNKNIKPILIPPSIDKKEKKTKMKDRKKDKIPQRKKI